MNEEYQHLADPNCKKCEGTGVIVWDSNALLACDCVLKEIAKIENIKGSEGQNADTSGEKQL